MKKFLDKILLSDNVVDNFHLFYNMPDFRKELNELIPQVEQCLHQQQNNPWHIYNVLDHILHSVEEMNKLSVFYSPEDKRLLAYTMFFHDIGKPACHIKRERNGKTIDSFFNHNIESAKIAKEILPQLDFSPEEVAIIETLIYKHDIFMFLKPYPVSNKYWEELSHGVVKREINSLNKVGDGFHLINLLVLVGRADSLAQNPKMVSFDVHNKMSEMITEVYQTSSPTEFEQ